MTSRLRNLDSHHRYETDKLGRYGRHDYTDAFEFHFGPYRDERIVLWEIGVDRGGSLAMWGDYFPSGTVVGIDVKPRPDEYECRPNTTWFCGDATTRETVDALLSLTGPPDIVLDDGSHHSNDIYGAFQLMFPVTKTLYAVEDLGTQYEEKHGHQFIGLAPFTTTLRVMCDDLAKNVEPVLRRVCWEPGQVFLYK